MTKTANLSGTITAANTPQSLWAANPPGTRCYIQNQSKHALTVIETITGIANPIETVLGYLDYIDETEIDSTAAVSVSGFQAGMGFGAWRGND